MIETHEEMLRLYGGHPGIPNFGKAAFNTILEDMKKIKGVYAQAAFLLRRLRTARIFDNAVKRTSAVAVVTFLRMNSKDIAVTYPQEIYIFIKDILKYDNKQIEEWLRDGKTPEEAREG